MEKKLEHARECGNPRPDLFFIARIHVYTVHILRE